MNMKKAILALLALFGFGLPAQAVTIVQLTSNNYKDALPQISGNYVVWQGQAGGNWEIFLHNLSTSTTTQITNNTTDDTSPQVDGDYIVWLGGGIAGKIYYYDISTSGPVTEVPISGSPVNSSPQIANGYITWTSTTVGAGVNPGETFLYRISTGTTTNISAPTDPGNGFDDVGVKINATMVGWNQVDEQSNYDPSDDVTTYMIYDIATASAAPAAADFTWPDSPQMDGNLSVYSISDGADREIFLRYQNRLTKQITDNSIRDTYPRISGTTIVWVGGTGAAAEIYTTTVPDTDGDTVIDTFDNCTNVADSDQRDTNSDGYGNMCDADLDNDGDTDKDDAALFRAAVGSSGGDADFNGDGTVDNTDRQMFRDMEGSPPGPSGLAQ